MNLLFNIFEGSNEEIMGKQQKEEVLWGNAYDSRRVEQLMIAAESIRKFTEAIFSDFCF